MQQSIRVEKAWGIKSTKLDRAQMSILIVN